MSAHTFLVSRAALGRPDAVPDGESTLLGTAGECNTCDSARLVLGKQRRGPVFWKD